MYMLCPTFFFVIPYHSISLFFIGFFPLSCIFNLCIWMENPPVGSFIVTPHGGNVITTNYLSLIARELFFFFGIVDSVLEKGVMAYRENTKGAMDVL